MGSYKYIDEFWKDVVGWEGHYRVSTHGRIRSLPRTVLNNNKRTYRNIPGKIIKPVSVHGYQLLTLASSPREVMVRVHRVVAQAFIPNPNNLPQVNHLDANKKNNHYTNLEWVDGLGNMRHAKEIGLLTGKARRGEKHPNSKLTAEAVRHIRRNEMSRKEYAKLYSVSYGGIYAIQKLPNCWAHLKASESA